MSDAKVAAGAAISRSKLAIGTPNYVLVNDGSGLMTGVATLPLGLGGTGATTVPGIWTVLGLGSAAGKDVGNNIGNVMAADVVPSCLPFEKLQMSLAPYQWTCVTDANTDSTKLPLSGGMMAGDIDMDGNQILNLSAPIVGSDAANKTYVDGAVSGSAVWSVTSGNTHRATGNVGVGTATPARNIEILNSDTDEAIRVSRATNISDEASIGFNPAGANSLTNQSWKIGLPVNSNSFSFSAFNGASTTNVLLLSPVGIVIPRLSTTERNAVSSPTNGLQIYNTSTNELNYYNGTVWSALGVAGSGVTSLVAGTGLTGGTITSSGTIAVDVGTGANQIVQLDGSSRLPSVNGSLLTNLNPTSLSSAVPVNKGGTGLSANGAANTILGMNAAGSALEYKAISGTGVTVTNGAGTMNFAVTGAPPTGAASGDLSGTYPGPSVVALQGTAVSATAPSAGNILLYNGSAYAPTAISGDASLVSTGVLTLGTVSVSKGGTGVTSLTAKGIVSVSGTGNSLVSTACADKMVLSFNATGDAVCSGIDSLSASFVQFGNSFGQAAILGTNDNNSLHFNTNTTTKMTITSSGFVGIGTTSPTEKLSIIDNNGSPGTNIFGVQNTNGAGAASFSMKNNSTGIITISASGSSYAGIPALYNKGTISTSGNVSALNFMTNGDLASGGTSPINFISGGYTVNPTMTITSGNPGNVGIGTTSPVALLDLTSTTSGILVPRMTTLQRDAISMTGRTGMQIYNTTTNQLNFHNGVSWQAVGVAGAGISSLTAGTGLSGGTITTSGTVAIANDGVTTVQIADGTITNLDISATSAIARSKLANGTAGAVVTNDASGVMTNIIGTANQMLGMNAAGTLSEFKTLTGTTPVTVTHGAGTVTLDLGTVPVSKGGTGSATLGVTKLVGSNLAGNLVAIQCSIGDVFTFDISGNYVCQSLSSLTSGSFIQNGNSFGVAAVLGTNDNNSLSFETNATTKMTILANGNVGIGTTMPAVSLQIRNSTSALTSGQELLRISGDMDALIVGSGPKINFENSSGNTVAASLRAYTFGGGATGLAFETGYGALSTKMVIDNSGNVGIGTINPNEKLHVMGGSSFSSGLGNVSIYPDYAGGGIIQSYQAAGVFRSLQIDGLGIKLSGKGSPIALMDGNVGINTSTPSEKFEVIGNAKALAFLYSSDKRLKKNITSIKKPLEKVLALNGVEFIWRNSGEHETGLIAQDVEKVVPNLVETSAVDGMKSVKYGNIVALLIESTKEQQREIASLKEENKKLKNDIELIKKHLHIK